MSGSQERQREREVGESIYPPGDIWQCLQIFLVVGNAAAGLYGSKPVERLAVHKTTFPIEKYPAQKVRRAEVGKPCVILTELSSFTVPFNGRYLLISLNTTCSLPLERTTFVRAGTCLPSSVLPSIWLSAENISGLPFSATEGMNGE